MKEGNQKKLQLHIETLRNLQAQDLDGRAGRWPTETERAGGCTVLRMGVETRRS
jgi:hypothetical protein